MNLRVLTCLFLVASSGGTSAARGAERGEKAVVWAASDGHGHVELLWSPISGWPAGGFRLERVCGSAVDVVAPRLVPLADPAAVAAIGAADNRAEIERLAAELAAGGAGARRAAAETFMRSAAVPAIGYAMGLRAVDSAAPGQCRYRLSGLDAKGAALWRVETVDLDPRRVTPALPAPSDLTAEIEGRGVRLRWIPPAAERLPAFTFSVERQVADETRLLTPTPSVPLRSPDDPHHGFDDVDPPLAKEALYRVSVYDILGRPSPSAEVTIRIPDLDALAPPEGLVATDEPGKIVLSWTPRATAGVAGYVLERSLLDGGPFVPLRGQPLSRETTRSVDEDVVEGTTYYYRLRSRTKGGETGDPSPTAWAQARSAGLPAAPEGLAAEAGRTRVRLAWAPVPGPVSGYLVERQTASGQWARLNPDYSAEPRFDDHPGPQDGAVMRYRVSTLSHRGQQSAPSEVVTVRLPDTVPPPEPRIVGLGHQPTGVVLSFLPGAPAASTAAFRVLRSERRDEPGLVLGPSLPASARSFTDPSARAGDTYFYRVVAVDEAGNRSAPSAPLRILVPWPAVGPAGAPRVEGGVKPFPHVRVFCPEPPPGLTVVVERRLEDEETFVVLGTLAGGEVEFLDARPAVGKTASYRVVYRDEKGARGAPSPAVEIRPSKPQ